MTVSEFKPGFFEFDSVPRGAYTFAWGGRGFAFFDGNEWFAFIEKAGCHPNTNWEGVVVDGRWHPTEEDLKDTFPIDERDIFGRRGKRFREMLARLGIKVKN